MTTQKIIVTKRNGKQEEVDYDKIHRVIEWAATGLNVSVSQVELKAHLKFFAGIKTSEIHMSIVRAAAELISVTKPDYQYLAARLLAFHARKLAYGDFEPDHLYDVVKRNVELNKYDRQLIDLYTKEELFEMEEEIVHARDMDFTYVGFNQLFEKYLVQNRKTGEIFETPQVAYMLIGAALFSSYPKETRMTYIKTFYHAASLGEISLPTPIMAGARTPTRQFSSCTLIEADDSLDGINAASSSIVKYVSQRAGIGINGGMIRARDSVIREGEVISTGVIPFWKHFLTAVKSCSQGRLCPL